MPERRSFRLLRHTDWGMPCSISSLWRPSPASGLPARCSCACANASEEAVMTLDYVLGAALLVALVVYLSMALLRPEKF